VAPTLPLGAHRHAVKPDADLSLPGIAGLVTEFLDRLGLEDVTLVGNDTGGAVAQLLIAGGAPRAGRVVLVSCEAFDNFPPGLTGKTLALAAKLPPAVFGLAMQQMRLRPARRLPVAHGGKRCGQFRVGRRGVGDHESYQPPSTCRVAPVM
jgi:pimeloyl-ACP methyl ester carboxylesterase